jgi:DNA binding domain, excisionase family
MNNVKIKGEVGMEKVEKIYLGVKEAADYLGLKPKSMYDLTQKRIITSYKSAGGKKVYFNKLDLEKYITAVEIKSKFETE